MSHVRQKGATLVGSSPAVYIKDEYQWFAFSLKWNNWNGFILGQAFNGRGRAGSINKLLMLIITPTFSI